MTTHEPQHATGHVQIPFALRALPVALIVGLLLTWMVHRRAGDEQLICATGEICSLGSGGSWLLTGVALPGALVALAGFAWSRHLHRRDRLGPFSRRAIPDGEQILEVISVLAAGWFSWWLIRNGGSIEAADIDELARPNSWLIEARDIRSDEPIDRFIPDRSTWFLVGAVLAAPFAFSLGSMIGREWYGRIRRSAQDADSRDVVDEEVIDLTVLDLDEIARQEHIDDN